MYWLFAGLAKSVLVVVDTDQRGCDLLQHDLATPAGEPREKQIGNVGTNDEQKESDRASEDD